MENRENNPRPIESKPLSSLEKIKTAPQNIKTVAMSVGIAAAIAGGAVSLDNATTINPQDLHKELNLGIGTEYKVNAVPSEENFRSRVVDPETGFFKQATPININEIQSDKPTDDEKQKIDAIKKAEKVKAEMELKAGVRKYKEETGK